MPIEDLTTGDIAVKQTAAHAIGPSGDDVQTWSDTAALACLIQTVGGSDSQKYAARGSQFNYNAFFSTNPGLTTNNRLKWTTRAGVALTTPIYLRVLDCYSEGPPGEDQLWIADLSQETMRSED